MQRCGLLMRYGAILCVAMLAVLAGHPIVIGQEQPPLGTTLQDYWCWKKHICRGASLTGQCVGAGFFCLEGEPSGCISKPGDGCHWSYLWACYPSCNELCTHVRVEEVGQDCGSACTWLSYNQCACSCQVLGVNTIEAGLYPQCR